MTKEMKVVIRHPKNLEYWSVMNSWTSQVAEAADFGFALNAIRYGVNCLGKPFVVAFKSEEPAAEFSTHVFAHEH